MATERKKTQPRTSRPFLAEYAPIPGAPVWLRVLLPCLVAIAAFVAFLPALDAGFVNWDDDKNILNNTNFRGLTGGHLKWMFETTKMGHWQPLSWITLALDYERHGGGDPADHPRGYHLTNMLLHAGGAAAFYFLALRLLALAFGHGWHGQAKPGRGEMDEAPTMPARPGIELRLGGAVAALFFAVHPLRVEAVAWVTERRDVLSGLFFIATINAYLISRTAPRFRMLWYGASIVLLKLSVLCKAWGMTMPAILLILDWYPLRRFGWKEKGAGAVAEPHGEPDRRPRRAPRINPDGERLQIPLTGILLEKLPFALIAIAVAVKAKAAQAGQLDTLKTLEEHGVLNRIAQGFYGLAFYVYKTVAPINLIPIYEIPVSMNPLAAQFVASAIAVAIAAGLIILFRRRWPAGVALTLCYLAIFSPVSGIAQSGPQLVKDSYTYLCCLSWAVLVGGLLIWIGRRWGERAVRVALAAGCPVLAVLGVLTWRQTKHWQSSRTLWEHTLAIDPNCWNAHNNLAILIKGEGDQLKKSGLTAEANEKYRQAAEHYSASLAVHADNAEALFNRGNCFKAMGEIDEAIASYLEAIAAGPEGAPGVKAAHLNLGNTYQAQNKLEQSTPHHAVAAVQEDKPDRRAQLFGFLVRDSAKLQRGRDAELYATLQRSASAVEVHIELAETWMSRGECRTAKAHYRQALRLQPQNERVRQALAAARAQCP